jgi:hypothetical protein
MHAINCETALHRSGPRRFATQGDYRPGPRSAWPAFAPVCFP